jgi:hypothetical protein
MDEIKVAQVIGQDLTVEKVYAYLPANYEVIAAYTTPGNTTVVLIAGTDKAGWTLDDYVIPRLGSGLYGCQYLGTRA